MERQAAVRLGLTAELRAAALLIAKGYRVLGRRWRGPMGEIDLVVRRRRVLVFVEVKARDDFDTAADSISPHQRQRIAAAAAAWLGRYPDTRIREVRFDVVLVVPRRWPRHIENAFEADD